MRRAVVGTIGEMETVSASVLAREPTHPQPRMILEAAFKRPMKLVLEFT